MTLARLTTLANVKGSAHLPAYDPENHGVGIVHLGMGAFHRAHQAVMTDDALAKTGGDWRIAGVSLRSKESANCLNDQNGLYTLLERSKSATAARVIASIDHVIAADSRATLALLCNTAIRIVTLTVTEAGYGINRQSRLPDTDNLVVASDLSDPQNPTGVLGLLVAAIARRRESGTDPFTVLSCDNLPGNGALLHDGVVGFARTAYSDELAEWITTNIAFPNSMVDRITPASTKMTLAEAAQHTACDDLAAVETEPFTQWIIENRFSSTRPRWEEGGAIFVSDVMPYERMKLTMLNGAHSMLAYAGFLAGCDYVRDVMQDKILSVLVKRHITAASTILDPLPGIDFNDYAKALIDRFENPAIAHETYQIATDGTQKLPQRIFEPALKTLDTPHELRPFAFATAMWMRYCLQKNDAGTAYQLRDPRAEEINALVDSAGNSASRLSDHFHALPDFIPKLLAQNKQWRADIDEILGSTLKSGCYNAIALEAASVNESDESNTALPASF